jgi:hypothetical protein
VGGDGEQTQAVAPVSRSITVPFTDRELALIAERAAAHGLSALEFLRFCALSQPTVLEASVHRRRGAR